MKRIVAKLLFGFMDNGLRVDSMGDIHIAEELQIPSKPTKAPYNYSHVNKALKNKYIRVKTNEFNSIYENIHNQLKIK